MYTQPVFGNYIGIVVADEDPEDRNRIQVWVPHISVGLYDGWNAAAQDVTITRDLGSLPVSIDKLKRLLPWAEPAAPVFGNGGTLRYNDTNKALHPKNVTPTLSPPQRNSGNGSGDFISPWGPGSLVSGGVSTSTEVKNSSSSTSNLSQLNPNIVKGLYGLGMVETGFNSSKATSDANNQLETISNGKGGWLTYVNSNVVEEYKKNGGDLAAAQAKYGDYGYFQVNSENNQEAGTSLNTGTASEQMIKIADYIKKINQDAYSALEAGDYTTAYDLLKGRWPSLNPKIRSGQLNEALANTKTDINQIIKNVENAEYITPPTVSASSSNTNGKIVKKGPDTTAGHNISDTDIRTPQGQFSTPAVGNLVWVFFYGGDVQKPVYFASVAEPNASGRIEPGGESRPSFNASQTSVTSFVPTNTTSVVTKTKSLTDIGENTVDLSVFGNDQKSDLPTFQNLTDKDKQNIFKGGSNGLFALNKEGTEMGYLDPESGYVITLSPEQLKELTQLNNGILPITDISGKPQTIKLAK